MAENRCTVAGKGAAEKHLGVVNLLLHLGADPNIEDSKGRTPLLVAVENNDRSAVRLLVAGGADLNHRARCGTALHHAICSSSPQTIKLLLELGADVNSRDYLNNTPLHRATRMGRLDAIELCLKNGANTDSTNREGMTPLDAAACSGSVEVFELLVEKGVNLCSNESKGLRLLSIAVECKHDPLALWLLSNEADLNSSMSNRKGIYRFLPACVSLCISVCFCACLPAVLY